MILYTEDEKTIGQNITSYLQGAGFIIDWYSDGSLASEAIQEKNYDCYILDINLPGKNGFELCEQIRKKSSGGIIMTTARGSIEDKTRCYDAGADDYLVKPFSLEELVLRLKAIMKRSDISDIVNIGEISVYTDENRINKNGKDIPLPLKERLIFIHLLENKGRTITRADLIEVLWGGEALLDNNDNKLDVYIAKLRKKIGKEYIETVKGVGYRIKTG